VERAAGTDDVPAVSAYLAGAFYEDPVWATRRLRRRRAGRNGYMSSCTSGRSPACGIRGFGCVGLSEVRCV